MKAALLFLQAATGAVAPAPTMEAMRQQAENVGTEIVYDLINEVDLEATPKRAIGDSGSVRVQWRRRLD